MKTSAELLAEIAATQVEPGSLAFWWLGQMSYVVKAGGQVLYFDPYLAPSERRQVPPLLVADDIHNADWVFGSHDHGDHIDPYAVPRIAAASPQARFVCSRASASHVSELGVPADRIVALDERLPYDDGTIRIEPIAAAHEFLDHDPKLGYPHLSFVVQLGGVTIYHSGDTLCYDGMVGKLARWQFDVMFVPINGRDAERLARNCIGNMTYQEAVDLVGELKPALAVPGHYDMFANNSADPSLFAAYVDVKYPGVRYWIGGHGERVMVSHQA